MDSCSVIVVGAGAAGLTAAYDLKKDSSCSVTVLEASDRHGGRTKKLTGLADFPIDLGGEWIQARDTSILNEIVNDESVDVDVETFFSSVDFFLEVLGRPFDVPGTFPVGYKFRNSTWYDFFNDYIFPVLEDDEISYNCQVTRIDYSSDPVQVESACGSYAADRVVVAVPLTVMQDGDIEFVPDLSRGKRRALGKLNMLPGLKAFFSFSEQFYPEAMSPSFDIVRFPGIETVRFVYDETVGQETTDNILGIFSYGRSATRLYGDLSDEEIVDSMLDYLDAVFDGAARRTFLDAHVQNWKNEPYIRGAYSRAGLTNGLYYERMRRPLSGRVYFAGEHLPAPLRGLQGENGYVHGAAMSGRYAVTTLLEGL